MSWRIVIAILLASIIMSCGDDEEPKSVPELKALFEQEASKFGFSLDLEDFDVDIVAELSGEAVGRCWYKGRGVMRGFLIELKASFWEEADAEERELLFFHEGGHCFLGQDHRFNSIMEPRMFSGYFDNRDFYIRELFSHGADMRRQIATDDEVRYVDVYLDKDCSHK